MICFDCDQVAQLQASYRDVLVAAECLKIFQDVDRMAMRDLAARAVLDLAEPETLDSASFVYDALDRLSHRIGAAEFATAA